MPLAAARDTHLAEDCQDEFCPRLPCRMFKEGYRRGHASGYDAGYDAGYDQGYSNADSASGG